MFKRSDPTDIWAWLSKDEERLLQKGGQHQAIVANYHEFWGQYHNDAVAAELAITQALEAARETNEIKWQLHLRHWRIQLWLQQRQTRRVLPEAVDLLSLATDRRVRDVPQRICAFHDIVECYIDIDPAGYYEEIVANSQDVLAQLPKRHPCATCARANLARASAAAGKVQDAEHWITQVKATMSQRVYNGLILGFAASSVWIEKWDDAERYYRQARDTAEREKNRQEFVHATLGLVRVHLEKKEIHKALDMLQNARQNMKFQSHPNDLAKLAEAEGRVAAVLQHPQGALEQLVLAARTYLDLGCYRDAAQTALLAAEVAREAKMEIPAEVLDLAAQAVGQVPPASQDLFQRLATFDRQPIEPTADALNAIISSAQEQDQKELRTLQDLLQQHVTQHHYANVSMTLHQLAIWHGGHDQMRAAVDYLVAEAILERQMKLPLDDREEALQTLSRLRKNLPDATIESALAAAQSGPPSWLQPLFPDMPLQRWRWIIRGIEAEMDNLPFVEPEPERTEEERDNAQDFQDWLNHSGGMTALILRFYQRCDPQEFVPWAEAMDDMAEDMIKHNSAAPEAEVNPLLSLVRGFAALARGSTPEKVLPPFADVLTQIAEIAKTPVWFHPDASPIDFLVEQAAQKAVRALRRHDPERERRLKNLALRYKLMAIDLHEHEPFVPIARFLDALQILVLSDQQQLPVVEPALEEPFAAILTAVFNTRVEA